MRFWKDSDSGYLRLNRASQGIEDKNVIHLFIEQLNSNRLSLGIGWKDIYHIATDTIGASTESNVIAGILEFGELREQLALVDHFAARDM